MDDRTIIAAMILAGLVSNIASLEAENLEMAALQYADDLIAELARAAPPAVESPLRNVKAGDVLFSRGGEQKNVLTADWPLAVVRHVSSYAPLCEPRAYDLGANIEGCTLASAEILAALAKGE